MILTIVYIARKDKEAQAILIANIEKLLMTQILKFAILVQWL